MIGHRAFSQATGRDKMTHFVWIIQEKNTIFRLETKQNDRIVKYFRKDSFQTLL